MFLTKKQLEEISRQIATISVKDTDFDETHKIRQGDSVAIVQDGKNKKIDIGELGGYFATIDERLIPDNEDISVREDTNVLSFADRSAEGYGMGYVILRRNKSFAEQVTEENTIYEIRYDFDLNGASVTVPSNCVLKFNGGKITDGTIALDGARIFPDFNTLVDNNSSLTYTGMPAAGTMYWQNGQPTWSNGTAWVDASGTEV